jgi:conjugal transfer pilus assembly protein TraF
MANSLFLRVFFLLLILFSKNSVAENTTYFTEHTIGWHWYKDPAKTNETEEAEAAQDPITQMSAVRLTVQRALDRAVLQPSQDNVKQYIQLQNHVSQQANQFNHYWQAVLLQHPELDFALQHPTNNLAKQVEYDTHHREEEKMLRQFAKQYPLYFFYKSTCPYCQRFAPILKDFAQHEGFFILPITMDGIALKEFPDSYVDQGESRTYQVTVEPTVFAVNPVTRQAIRVSTGLVSEEEMKKNIIAVLTHFEGDVR